ncbi:MAG: hypothetical protein QM669_05875 [Siphonobacter sp.]
MKKLSLSLMSLLGAASLFAQTGKPLYTFPIGVQAYTYRNEFAKDVEKTLDLIQSLGSLKWGLMR